MDLAGALKSHSVDVSISSIIVSDNKYNEIAITENSHLKLICIVKSILFVDYEKTTKSQNLSKNNLNK